MSNVVTQGVLRVQLRAEDAVRRHGLAAMVQSSGHCIVTETPDVVLCDLDNDAVVPAEAEAPVVALTSRVQRGEAPAGLLPREVSAVQLDAALRAVAAGLQVRSPSGCRAEGFRAAGDDAPDLLTPREVEILTLLGQGMSNKAAARHLGISVHTVKFHLEAMFAKLEASSRAEAVAKGLRGGIIEF